MTLNFIQNMGGGFVLILFLFSAAYFILWVYCLVDVIRSDFKDQNMKLIWIIVILFGQVIGPLAYLFLGKSSKVSY
mgnify:CR=1 FL=1